MSLFLPHTQRSTVFAKPALAPWKATVTDGTSAPSLESPSPVRELVPDWRRGIGRGKQWLWQLRQCDTSTQTTSITFCRGWVPGAFWVDAIAASRQAGAASLPGLVLVARTRLPVGCEIDPWLSWLLCLVLGLLESEIDPCSRASPGIPSHFGITYDGVTIGASVMGRHGELLIIFIMPVSHVTGHVYTMLLAAPCLPYGGKKGDAMTVLVLGGQSINSIQHYIITNPYRYVRNLPLSQPLVLVYSREDL